MLLARSRRSLVLLTAFLTWFATTAGLASRAAAADPDRGAEISQLCTQSHGAAGGRGRGMNGTHRRNGIWLAADRAAERPASIAQVAPIVLRALAVTSDRRFAALPDVPTVKESGLPGYNVASWNGLAAPAGTPPAVIEALNKAAHEAVSNAAVQDRLGRLGMRLQAGTPAELQALLGSEIRRWGDVIRAAKIEPE